MTLTALNHGHTWMSFFLETKMKDKEIHWL